MKLLELLSEYEKRTSPKADTVRLFKLAIRQFAKVVLATADAELITSRAAADLAELPRLEDLTEERMAAFVASRRLEGIAAGTIAGEQRKLFALWRYACKRGYITIWPASHPVKVPARIPRAWTREELRRLFDATKFATSSIRGSGSPLWWRCLFSVLWDTGERITAVLSLCWDNVDLEGLTVYIPAEDRKGGQVDRLYPIAPETAELLALLPRDRRPFWFPWTLSTLYRRLERLLKKGGLPADRRSKFHRIRRSTASHYEAAGGNATELLGHTSRKVTRGYLDPRIVRTASAVDLLFRPAGPVDDVSADKRADS